MVNMAVLGCGKIVDRFIKGLRMCDNVTLVGFGSNNIEKAREYCEKYGASVYGDYDRIMNDPDIDAIYVSNFNQAHYRTVKSCLQHGKHVLCEHPLVPNMDELNELFELAKEKDLLLMEACKGTFLPMITEIKELIEQGKLGKIIYVHASDSSNAHMPENHWLMQPPLHPMLSPEGNSAGREAGYRSKIVSTDAPTKSRDLCFIWQTFCRCQTWELASQISLRSCFKVR